MKFYSTLAIRLVIPGIISVTLISACNLPGGISLDSVNITAVYQTANAVVSRGIKTLQPNNPASEKTPPLLVITPTPMQATSTDIPTEGLTTNTAQRCDQAGAGNPLDVTIPDDTRLVPGEEFTKIWRLLNLGTCDWSTGYAMVWFSGDDMGAVREQPFLSTVAQGETIDFAVDMVAPAVPGLFSGYWMLRSASGDLFGIGPNGNSPVWVRIQVVAVETPIPTSTATVAPTSIVQAEGPGSLLIGQTFDLDSGQTTVDNQVDMRLEGTNPDTLQWTPLNNARFAVFGLNTPGELECQYATMTDQPLAVSNFEAGIYLCYRTSEGLPGRLKIESLPVDGSPLTLNFTTWAVP